MLLRLRQILLLAIVLFSALPAAAQVPMPDNVCAGAVRTYWVDSLANPGSTYTWSIDGTVVQTGAKCALIHTWKTEGTYELSVQMVTAEGCAAEPQTGQVIVTPSPPATVSITADQTTVCSGTTVTFTATPVNGGTTPVYQWLVNGANAGTNSHTYAYTPSDGDKVKVLMTSSETCISGSPATSGEIAITVNSVLPASVTINADQTTVCSGTTVTFTATPVNGGATPVYQWQVNGTNAGANSHTYSYAPADGDKVKVVMTSTETCVSGSPATSGEIAVVVNSILPASVSITSDQTTVCSGTTVTYTASPENGGTTPVYQWQVNGTNAGTNSHTYSYAPADGDKVKVVMTSSETCVSGSPAMSGEITMTVNSTVVASVSITVDQTQVCNGTQVTFTATPVNGGATPVYQWQVNGANAGTNSHTFIYEPLPNDKVIALMTSGESCASGNPAASNEITIMVNTLQPAEVTIIADQSTVYEGTPVTFTALPVNGGANPVYEWFVNGIAVPGETEAIFTYTPEDMDLVNATLLSSAPCSSGYPVASNFIGMQVNPLLPVSVTIATSSTAICEGASATFTATPVNGGLNPVFTWYVNSMLKPGEVSGTYTYQPADGDEVYAILLSDAENVSGNPATSEIIKMTVHSLPVVAIDPVPPLCTGSGTFTLTGSPAGGTFSGTGVSGNTFNPMTAGVGIHTITYSYTDPDGCTSTAETAISVTTTIIPVFSSLTPVCTGDVPPVLPADSDNGITGKWTPATISTDIPGEFSFTFVPDAGQCASATPVIITIGPRVLPTFNTIGPLWQSSVPPSLPTASLEGISGSWSPSAISTSDAGTFTYNFIPDDGQCADGTSIEIVIKTLVVPVFDPIGPFCQNSAAPGLPLISKDGITGAWTPAMINTSTPGTFAFIFNPDPDQGSNEITINIEITPLIDPIFNSIGPLCMNSAPPDLPLSSTNGISGTWVPSEIITGSSGTFAYIFNPDPDQCASPVELTVTITTLPDIAFTPVGPLCMGTGTATLTASPAGGVFTGSGVTGNSFDPSATGPGKYTITYNYDDPGGCSNSESIEIEVNAAPVLVITDPDAACMPGTVDLTAPPVTAGSSEGLELTYWTDATATTAFETPKTAGAGTYYIKGLTSAGCFDIKPVTVNINASPTLVITNPSPVCEPNTIDLNAADIKTGSTPGLTYTYWTDAGATIQYTTPATAGSGTYYIKGSTPDGCFAIEAVVVSVTGSVGTPVFTLGATSTRCQAAGTEIYTAAADYSTSLVYSLDAASASAGNTINPTTGAVTFAAAWSGTSVITATANGCNGPATAIHTVTVIPVATASISYDGSPFCTTEGSIGVNLTGTPGGTFTASPAGLSIEAGTGTIVTGSSNEGTYTVTYTVSAEGGCGSATATATVAIIKAADATISYTGSPFCTTTSPVEARVTGAPGGMFSAEPSGLAIDAITGTITPAASIPDTYTITYTAITECGVVTDKTTIIINYAPEAGISYQGSPFCTSEGPVAVLLTGDSGGAFTSDPAGLVIDKVTGEINPSTSREGRYTVIYTIAASGGCGPLNVTAQIDILSAPSASIEYVGAPFCLSSEPMPVSLTGTAGGAFTAEPAGLTIDPITGKITPSSSKVGSYVITYTIPDTGECSGIATTTSVWILPAPIATITYNGSPFCITAEPAEVILTGSSGGKFTAEPPGLFINGNTGTIKPTASLPGTYTVTYTAVGVCGRVTATTEVTITTGPTAKISYPGSPFCSTAGPVSVVLDGASGGLFSASPAGLAIDPVTGEINPSSSLEGIYIITYTNSTPGECGEGQTLSTATITITRALSATFYYAGTPFCTNFGPGIPTFAGSDRGTFTSESGLTINSSNGTVTPGTSTPGIYTVTYRIPASGACGEFITTASVEILAAPYAKISYEGPYCTTVSDNQPVTLTGDVGGSFSSTPGLVLNRLTGAILPSTSKPGTYLVTYTVPPVGICGGTTATASLIINSPPEAEISYSGSPFCKTLETAQPVTLIGDSGGTFKGPNGLWIDPATGAIYPSRSNAGKFQVTYTIPASGGCGEVSATAFVTITTSPSATIFYPGSPYCATNNASQPPNVTTTGLGTFRSTAGLHLDGLSGAINPGMSLPGTYTVTYTLPASGGCDAVTATASVIIKNGPTASISYPALEFCSTSGPVQPTIDGASGGKFSADPAGLDLDESGGTLSPATSIPGRYTVTYTVTDSDDCGEVLIEATASVTITALPVASFAYSGNVFCSNVENPLPVLAVGGQAGLFTSAQGLVFTDIHTGQIDLPASAAGTYTVTNTIEAAGGCGPVAATSEVTIIKAPEASISYPGSPYCDQITADQPVSFTGTSGGAFTATPSGLTINAASGAINPGSSKPGTYIITYTINSTGLCTGVAATASVTIAPSSVEISYANQLLCTSSDPVPVLLSGLAGGTFTVSPDGLSINPATGEITPQTSIAGMYTITYTTPDAGCGLIKATAVVTITGAFTAGLNYPAPVYCMADLPVNAILTGTSGGSFTATPDGLSIHPATGEITPANSNAGGYEVTYSIPASGGCKGVTATASVTILPYSTIISSPKSLAVIYPANAGFGVKASGSGLSYQWQVNTGSGFADISNSGIYSGASSDSLRLISPDVSMSGYQYRVIVRSLCPDSIISKEAVLTVLLKELVLTVTAEGIDKMYDGNIQARVKLSDNRKPGDSLVLDYSNATFDTRDVGTDKPVQVTGIVISGPDAGKYVFNTTTTTTADITPKPVTVTATPGLTKIYGEPDPLLTYSYAPAIIDGDAFTGSLIRVPGENPGLYPILQGTLTLGMNYTITYVSNDFEITPKTFINVIVYAGQNKVYGEPDPILTYSYYPELEEGDFFTGQLSRQQGENVGEYLINKGTLWISPKYAIILSTSYLIITPKPITLTAVADTKTYDGTIGSGQLPAISPDLAFSDKSLFRQTFDTKNVGTGKTLTPSGRVNDGNDGRNYTVTYFTADLGTIIPKPITGIFTAADKVYDGTVLATILTRSLEGAIPGDDVRYVGGTATFDTPTVGQDKTVTGTGFSLSGIDAKNYTVNDTAVTRAAITKLLAGTLLTVNSSTFTHYSDLVTLTATISGGAPLANGPQAAESVTFSIEGRELRDNSNNTRIPLKVTGQDLVASITISILETTTIGSMTPGTKEVSAFFNDESINYDVAPNPAKASFIFQPGFDIVVYPNPSPGNIKFHISVDVGIGETVLLDLYAPNGQLIERVFEGFIAVGESKTLEYGSRLAQGIYLYRAQVGKNVKVGNIIIIGVY